MKPRLVVTARNLAVDKYDALAATGIAVITLPETRWARCDIKSTALLANVLAKQQAREAGAFEAWFVDRDGFVTEGASTNAWIVDANGVLRTRALGPGDFARCDARRNRSACAGSWVSDWTKRRSAVEAAKAAREAFVTSASAGFIPVTSIDGVKLGDGKPGAVARSLRDAYWASRTGRWLIRDN